MCGGGVNSPPFLKGGFMKGYKIRSVINNTTRIITLFFPDANGYTNASTLINSNYSQSNCATMNENIPLASNGMYPEGIPAPVAFGIIDWLIPPIFYTNVLDVYYGNYFYIDRFVLGQRWYLNNDSYFEVTTAPYVDGEFNRVNFKGYTKNNI